MPWTSRAAGRGGDPSRRRAKWAGDRPLLGGPIAARNIASLRYVSHCGYRPCQVEYLDHCWLDEG